MSQSIASQFIRLQVRLIVNLMVLSIYLCFRTLMVTSTLNLSELIGMKPELAKLRKIIYFHENQLVYPVQKTETSDYQFGYNEIISAYAFINHLNTTVSFVSFAFFKELVLMKLNSIQCTIRRASSRRSHLFWGKFLL